MEKRIIEILVLLFVLFGIGTAIADIFDEVVGSVQSVCTRPAESGKYWNVDAKGEGDVSVSLTKLPQASLGGTLNFTKGEWEGVQRVLQDQVASDSANYRECVKELTPLFLKKIPSREPPADLSGRWDGSGYYWIVRPSAKHNTYKIEKFSPQGGQVGEGSGTYSEGVFSFQLNQVHFYDDEGLLNLVPIELEGQLGLSGDTLTGSTDDMSTAEWNEFFEAAGDEPFHDDPSYVSRITLTRKHN